MKSSRCLIFALLLLPAFSSCVQRRGGMAAEEEAAPVLRDTVYPLGFCTDSFRVVNGSIRSGDNFTAWVTRLGLSPERSRALTEACDTVFDVRKMRTGNSWKAYYQDSTVLR